MKSTTGPGEPPNIICADFTTLQRSQCIDELIQMTRKQRDAIEQQTAAQVAHQLLRRLPENNHQRAALIHSGQALVAAMGWDNIVASSLVPSLHRVVNAPREGTVPAA